MSIGVPKPTTLEALGVYFKDGELWCDRKDIEHHEWKYWIAENTGFTWDPDSETPDNFMGVSWFACSDQRHDSFEAAEEESRAYAKLHEFVLVRVKMVHRTEKTRILSTAA